MLQHIYAMTADAGHTLYPILKVERGLRDVCIYWKSNYVLYYTLSTDFSGRRVHRACIVTLSVIPLKQRLLLLLCLQLYNSCFSSGCILLHFYTQFNPTTDYGCTCMYICSSCCVGSDSFIH